MPIYEYKCSSCGHEFEKLQKVSDLAIKHCPNCDGDHAQRLVSAAGFRLTGSGWYETDFKGKSSKKADSSDSGSSKTSNSDK